MAVTRTRRWSNVTGHAGQLSAGSRPGNADRTEINHPFTQT